MGNGAENIEHFAGAMKYGKIGAWAKTITDDGKKMIEAAQKGDVKNYIERSAEVYGNFQGANAGNEISKQLKNKKWDDIKKSNEIGNQFKKRFCK